MSERAVGPAAGVGGLDEGPGMLLWRESLADGPRVPGTAELDAWCLLLAREGLGRWSSLLDQCHRLVSGATGGYVWMGRADRSTVDLAFDELRGLAREFGRQVGLAVDDQTARTGRPDDPRGIAPDRRYGMPREIAGLADDLVDELLTTQRPDDERLLRSLGAAAELGVRFPHLDYRDWRRAPLPTLVRVIAQIVLIDFVGRMQDLWRPPYGSPALLRAAARLDRAGLGPYLRNVRSIARGGGDVYDMARVAVDAGPPDSPPDARGAWIVMLSRALEGDLLHEVLDELGDVAAADPLLHMLRVLGAGVDSGARIDALWRLRDIGLDNANHRLAIAAQALVVKIRAGVAVETMLLGTIQATAGEIAAAAGTFHEMAASGEDGALERLDALRRNRFDPFLIGEGIISPADRQSTRLYRRGDAPGYARRWGARIEAVDVR